MSHESFPESGWGRVREQCKNCPSAQDSSGERYCKHPWRSLIETAVSLGKPVTYEIIAQAWDMGATVGEPVESSDSRPSVEISNTEIEAAKGTVVFRIN